MGSYESMHNIRMDPLLSGRVQSSVLQQANLKPPPDSPFVQTIKLNSMSVVSLFVNLMSTAQDISDAYETGGNEGVTDYMILVSVQANWDEVEKLWQSTQPVPVP